MISYGRVINIYEDKNGDHIYVEPDADGLDVVEIRGGLIMARCALTKEHALLVAKAIYELYGDKE